MIRVIRRLFGSLMWKIYTTTWSPPNRPNQIFSSFFFLLSFIKRKAAFSPFSSGRPNKTKSSQGRDRRPAPFRSLPLIPFRLFLTLTLGKQEGRERERESVCEREKKRRVHCLFVTKGQSIIGFLPFLFPTLQK